jgi:hypothetical protein
VINTYEPGTQEMEKGRRTLDGTRQAWDMQALQFYSAVRKPFSLILLLARERDRITFKLRVACKWLLCVIRVLYSHRGQVTALSHSAGPTTARSTGVRGCRSSESCWKTLWRT